LKKLSGGGYRFVYIHVEVDEVEERRRREGGAGFYRVGILTEAHFTVESGLSKFSCCGIVHFTVGLRLFYSA
jgi:hypothetical protein